jgi:8-oxo-dGTP diphosphatase
MSHEAGRGNLKVVQFWRMQAVSGPVRPLTRDVKAVQWLPLDEAVKKLTHSREQMFLANVKSTVLQAAERSGRTAPLAPPVQPAVDDLVSATAGSARKGLVEQMRSWVRRMALTPPRKAR